jgi:hypothetical protein
MQIQKLILLLITFSLLSSAVMANSLTDLLRSGAAEIVRQSDGHFPDSAIDSFAEGAKVLSKLEVEQQLNIQVIDERIVYVSYPINDCVVQTAIVSILPGSGVLEIWYQSEE